MNGKVAASTQNQAFNALLFLFRDVLNREFRRVILDIERVEDITISGPVFVNKPCPLLAGNSADTANVFCPLF